METKQLVQELHSVWNDMKSAMAEQAREVKAAGEATQETKNYVNALNNRLDEIETAIQRPSFSASDPERESNRQAKAAMLKALRYGHNSLEGEERKHVQMVTGAEYKALSLGDDTGGGYLAPSEFVNEIIKGVVLFSPIREYARVRTTNNRSVIVPTRTGTMSAAWVSETGTRSDRTGLTYGQLDIPTHEMYAEIIVSEQDLEDSAFDLEAEIRSEISEQMGVAEGAAFISGNGVGRPEGLLSAPDVATTNTGSAAALTADGLITLAYALKDAYARNATWIMRRETIGEIRKLVDGQNQYLWQPGLAGDRPNTILDRPYVEMADMPAVAADAVPILFGDIKRAYTIVDRVGMVFKRLTEKYAESGQIAILARRRVGGQVVLNEAIRTQTVAA